MGALGPLPSTWPYLLTIGLGIVVAAAGIACLAARRRRHCRRLAALAGRYGGAFTPGEVRTDTDHCPSPRFRPSDPDFRVRDVVTGRKDGHAFAAFEFAEGRDYVVESSVREASGVGLRLPRAVKPLVIQPVDALGWLTKDLLDWSPLDFESGEFNRRFRAITPDRRWAFDFVHARLMEFLLAGPPRPLSVQGHWLYTWRLGRQKPEDIEAALAFLCRIREMMPDYVLSEGQARASGVDG